MPDVTVVGGGPAGLLSAKLMAASGRDVVLVEEHREIGIPEHCGGMLTPETLSMSGVTPEILGTVSAADVVFPGGRVLSVGRRTPMFFAVNSVDLDNKMADKAAEYGVDIRTGVKCNHYSVDEKAAVADTNAGTIRSDILVGADGPSSKIAAALTRNLPAEVLVGIQADIRYTMEDQSRMVLRLGHSVAPGFFSWQLPLGDVTRVGVCVSPPKVPSEYLKEVIKASGLQDMEVIRRFSGKIPIGGRRISYANRLMLIGDSAGMIKPVSGGGLYPIFKAAPILRDTVDRAYEMNVFNSSVMALYERGWKRELGRDLKAGARLRKHFVKLSDAQMDAFGELFDTPEIRGDLGMIDFDSPGDVVRPILSQKGALSGTLKILMRGRRCAPCARRGCPSKRLPTRYPDFSGRASQTRPPA